MTELERFRDHAAEMATADHKPECRAWVQRPSRWWGEDAGWEHPDPACPGCVTDDDRALWLRLAAEIEAYLTDDDAPLWEDE